MARGISSKLRIRQHAYFLASKYEARRRLRSLVRIDDSAMIEESGYSQSLLRCSGGAAWSLVNKSLPGDVDYWPMPVALAPRAPRAYNRWRFKRDSILMKKVETFHHAHAGGYL